MRSESEMTREDIIRMAREARFTAAEIEFYGKAIERFAAIAIAAEREACAKMCEDWPIDQEYVYSIGVAIRARGEK